MWFIPDTTFGVAIAPFSSTLTSTVVTLLDNQSFTTIVVTPIAFAVITPSAETVATVSFKLW